jgi:hypothetical protein
MFKEEGRRKNINLALVSANNHYAGFAPGTANLFRKMVDLPEAAWGKGRIRRMRMKANRIYIVAVVVTSGRIIQWKGRVQILRRKVISQYVNILQLVF